MKSLILFALVLSFATPCHAVGNRVVDSLKSLREIGFDFVLHRQESKDRISFTVTAPKGFDAKDEAGLKPFEGMSLFRSQHKADPGPGLLGAPGSYSPLECRLTGDGRHRTSVTVNAADAGSSYLMAIYRYDESGAWPMVVHIPVSSIIQQWNAGQDGADPPAPAPELKPEAKQPSEPAAEGRPK